MNVIPKTHFYNDFISFIVANNILTSAAAVTIAFSTGVMIRSLTADIILPTFYRYVLRKSSMDAFAAINKMNFSTFIKEFMSWIFVIIITFIIVEYVVRRRVLKLQPSSLTSPAPVGQEYHKKDDTVGNAVAGGEDVTEQFIRWR
jgi:large-conductance mechanosensitive channel